MVDEDFETPKEIIEINNQAQLHEFIFQEDDITWQSMIYELARGGQIDPWDIDISVLTREYILMLRKLKEHNFRLSGKVILAAAILLKLKTENIGVEALLALTNPEQFEEPEQDDLGIIEDKHFTKAGIDLRIPMPRKRKITMFELVSALKQALEVDERRRQKVLESKQLGHPFNVAKHFDIFSKIEQVYKKLKELFMKFKRNMIEFEEILPSREKKDKIWTLVPLLHLAQQDRINLRQESSFGKIFLEMNTEMFNKALKKEEIEKTEKNG